ncbi:hypothetical protein HKD37_09G024627 [Glycine soja]
MDITFSNRAKMWEIKILEGFHQCVTHMISLDHSKLGYKKIAKQILPLIRKDSTFSVPVLIEEIKKVYTYRTTYIKAWMTKQRAIEQVYGNWEESYKQPDQPLKEAVWFQPIVQVDGTWLYKKYTGTLLITLAQDGNKHIFSITIFIVEDTKLSRVPTIERTMGRRQQKVHTHWTKFMQKYKNAGCARKLLKWVSNTFMSITFIYIIYVTMLTILTLSSTYVFTETMFIHHYNDLKSNNVEAAYWFKRIPKKKWTQAFDESR